MTMATKHEVLREHLKDWLEANGDKKRRAKIAQVVCEAIRIHPKSVSRAFRRLQMSDASSRESGGSRRGRRPVYGQDVTAALFQIWEVGDYPCGELLHPIVSEYVTVLGRDGEWKHGQAPTDLLLHMSLGTMKRRVLGLAKKHGRSRGMSSTKPSSLKSIIPIFKGPWDGLSPGVGQIDTVAHCGDTLLGNFVFTVNYTDVATYWVIPRAQWNKGQVATAESLQTIRAKLPFEMRGLHPDTGSEFINWNLKAWCDKEHIDLTRSEPGKKNDNMYVEERNGHIVRRYLGYTRYDAPETVIIINELYDVLALYVNHWKPVRRQLKRERIGSKYVRVYEARAKTPYQRVLEHPSISEEVKRRLQEEHETLNPLHLKKRIDMLKMKAYKLQQATRNRRESPPSFGNR